MERDIGIQRQKDIKEIERRKGEAYRDIKIRKGKRRNRAEKGRERQSLAELISN